tara:strand:- start:418 stop:630 length:213 start_codon:yes stop_codon:yes gene_type:complete
MLRAEMIDNLLDSYTAREVRSLADRLGVDLYDDDGSHADMLFLTDRIGDILFDPAVSHHEFNNLANLMEQ